MYERLVIQILLYHGTISKFKDSFIENGVLLNKAKPKVDFGAGFYTSVNKRFAERTARNHAFKFNNKSDGESVLPLIITFEIEDDVLSSLNTRRFDRATAEWLQFVLYNRVKPEKKNIVCCGNPFDLRDVVIGPIADASIVSLIYDINDNKKQWTDISPDDVSPYDGGAELQYSFHTENALSYLRIVKYELLKLPKGVGAL